MSDATLTRPGWLRILSELTRAKVTVAVTLTTATGCVLGSGRVDSTMWLTVLGVFLLASGSSALNQIQERRIDARMERTRNRPLPSGAIDVSTALFIAILLMLLGLYFVTSVGSNTTTLLILGAFAVVWYNGVYTYLKRITAFAVVPGALIGAVPPVIGYVATGGDLESPLIVLVAAFFFIWQIPHFWLLLLTHGGQYSDADLPVLTRVFSRQQLRRITFTWLVATSVSGLVFPAMAHGAIALPWSLAIVAASMWMTAKAVSVLRPAPDSAKRSAFSLAFLQVNAYALAIMVCLSLNALLADSNEAQIAEAATYGNSQKHVAAKAPPGQPSRAAPL